MPKDELLRFNNHLLNYGDEARLDELRRRRAFRGLRRRETQRALAGVRGKCKVLPGIDIGIPTGPNTRQASPDDTYVATLRRPQGRGGRFILSRKYSEMQLANLAAAGRAVRENAGG